MTEALKNDSDKPRMELIPPDALFALAEVFTFGARKYAPWNWTKGFDWSRLYGAAQRHLNAWWNGENTDEETGFSHLAHALCCVVMLVVHERRGLGKDDRAFLVRKPGWRTAVEDMQDEDRIKGMLGDGPVMRAVVRRTADEVEARLEADRYSFPGHGAG